MILSTAAKRTRPWRAKAWGASRSRCISLSLPRINPYEFLWQDAAPAMCRLCIARSTHYPAAVNGPTPPRCPFADKEKSKAIGLGQSVLCSFAPLKATQNCGTGHDEFRHKRRRGYACYLGHAIPHSGPVHAIGGAQSILPSSPHSVEFASAPCLRAPSATRSPGSTAAASSAKATVRCARIRRYTADWRQMPTAQS